MAGVFVLLLANIFIATCLADGDTYVYSSNTPVYYPEKVGTALKVGMTKQKFSDLKAKNSGNSNALFVKVLIVTHSDRYEQKSEDALKVQAEQVIKGINSEFSSIGTSRPVEFLSAGLVVMKTSNLYASSARSNIYDIGHLKNNLLTDKYRIEGKLKLPSEKYYQKATSELENFAAWFKDNKGQFEDLDVNIILYLSPYYLSDDTADIKEANLVMGLAEPSKVICSSTPIVLVNDLIGDANAIYAMAVSYALGVSHPQDKPDYPYFTGNIRVTNAKKQEWKDKVVQVVDRNSNHNKYNCMQSSTDYDDE